MEKASAGVRCFLFLLLGGGFASGKRSFSRMRDGESVRMIHTHTVLYINLATSKCIIVIGVPIYRRSAISPLSIFTHSHRIRRKHVLCAALDMQDITAEDVSKERGGRGRGDRTPTAPKKRRLACCPCDSDEHIITV